jgi:hypothetical protein
MYVGLIEPRQYSGHGGFLEFLQRISSEKDRDPIPPLQDFIELAKQQLDHVKHIYLLLTMFLIHIFKN